MSRLHRNYLQQIIHIRASVMAICFLNVSLRMFTSIPASEVFVVIFSHIWFQIWQRLQSRCLKSVTSETDDCYQDTWKGSQGSVVC